MNAHNQSVDRYVRFQFWLSDHDGTRILFSEWSDGEIEEADVMLADRIVDIQHWDAHSGVILNHLVDSGWQVGTMPYGINPDEPVPEMLPDHETPGGTAGTPLKKEVPDYPQTPKPAHTPPTQAPHGPPGEAPEPQQQTQRATTTSAPPQPTICIFPSRRIAPVRTERCAGAGLFPTLCGLIWLVILMSALDRCSSGSASATTSAASARAPALQTTSAHSSDGQRSSTSSSSSEPLVRRALAVSPSVGNDKPVVRRALPVVVRRATLVSHAPRIK